MTLGGSVTLIVEPRVDTVALAPAGHLGYGGGVGARRRGPSSRNQGGSSFTSSVSA